MTDETFLDATMPHIDAVWSIARRMSAGPAAAEDMVQETYARAWRGFEARVGATGGRAVRTRGAGSAGGIGRRLLCLDLRSEADRCGVQPATTWGSSKVSPTGWSACARTMSFQLVHTSEVTSAGTPPVFYCNPRP